MGTNAERTRRWYKEVWKPGGESTVLELMAENIVGFMEGVDIPAGTSSWLNGKSCSRLPRSRDRGGRLHRGGGEDRHSLARHGHPQR